MSELFSKEEAVALLGQTFQCVNTYSKSFPDTDVRLEIIVKGSFADVVLVEWDPDTKNISVSLLVDEDFLSLNKVEFEHIFVPVDSSDIYTFPLFETEREECLLR